MLADDLDRGTKTLHWYDKAEDKEDNGEESAGDASRSVGGTAAHAMLIKEARCKLKARLDTRAPAPPVATTHKVQKLLEYLRTERPRKVLVFTQQRVTCRLLMLLLEAELERGFGPSGWSVGWACRSGPVGISKGRGSLKYTDAKFAASVQSFRDDLRLLVSTSVLEEGINVPDCDAVVDFDGATTSRGLQQRSGRARAKKATYIHLTSSDEAEREYENLLGWNRLNKQLLANGGRRQTPTPPCAEAARREIGRDGEMACVRTYHDDGRSIALLPLRRCKELLSEVYVKKFMVVRPGDAPFELDLASDGSHFTDKERPGGNFNLKPVVEGDQKQGFSCALRLPGVSLCSVDVGDKLPITLPRTEKRLSKADAKHYAALEGVRYLRLIGVLDEHLMVVGRAEAIRKLREEAGGGRRRSSTRANKYMLHVKEPVVRELPALLGSPPAADAKGGLTVWCHPMVVVCIRASNPCSMACISMSMPLHR